MGASTMLPACLARPSSPEPSHEPLMHVGAHQPVVLQVECSAGSASVQDGAPGVPSSSAEGPVLQFGSEVPSLATAVGPVSLPTPKNNPTASLDAGPASLPALPAPIPLQPDHSSALPHGARVAGQHPMGPPGPSGMVLMHPPEEAAGASAGGPRVRCPLS